MGIAPDSKDWTWVLGEPCPDCGFDARALDVEATGDLVMANAARWPELLARDDAAARPTDDRWSALEYGCHVRDVFVLFDRRLQLMLTEDGPDFENWDQDVTAIEERYCEQDPTVVATELVAAAETIAGHFRAVEGDQWERTGFRSDGAAFTVDSFARYFLHDPVHHVWDVDQGNARLDAA